jgi:hypothetical protein
MEKLKYTVNSIYFNDYSIDNRLTLYYPYLLSLYKCMLFGLQKIQNEGLTNMDL